MFGIDKFSKHYLFIQNIRNVRSRIYLLMLRHLLLTGFQNSRFWNLKFQILENLLFSAMQRLLRSLEAAPARQSVTLDPLQLTNCYNNFITNFSKFQNCVPEFQISGKCSRAVKMSLKLDCIRL